jgi:hypothetical protein
MRVRIVSRPGFWMEEFKKYAGCIAQVHLKPMGIECEFSDSGNTSHITIMLDQGESSNVNTRGAEVFYSPENPLNERLAKYLIDGICSSAGFMNRGIRAKETEWDIHIVCGYVTNADDRRILRDGSKKRNIAWGIMEGLKECLQRQTHTKRQNFKPA